MSPDVDALRDALALIEAVHRRDGVAERVLLDHADQRLMAHALAAIAEGLITDLAHWNNMEPSDALARLRRWGGGHE